MSVKQLLLALIASARAALSISIFTLKIRVKLALLRRSYAKMMDKTLRRCSLPRELRGELLAIYRRELRSSTSRFTRSLKFMNPLRTSARKSKPR